MSSYDALLESLCEEDPDIIDLGLAHTCQAVSPRQNPELVNGVIFHCGNENSLITIHIGTQIVTNAFAYMHHMMPYLHCLRLPMDKSLCCWFFFMTPKPRPAPLDVRADGVSIPFKYIVPRSSPIDLGTYDPVAFSHNLYARYPEYRCRALVRKRAVRKIQKWWLEIYLSPYTKVGRRKLERDYQFYLDGIQPYLSADTINQPH